MIGVGFTEIDAMKAVAKQFPKTHFAIVDVSNADEGGLKNVEGLLFKEQEAGYLAGYAAGLAAKERGGKAVSSVGGQKQPPVDRYIAGFQAGAKPPFPALSDERLLAGLREPGEVQGGRAEPDRRRFRRRVPGRRRLRARRARRSEGERRLGRRRRRRPGLSRLLRPDLGAEAGRHCRLQLDQDANDGHFKGGQDSVYGLDVNGGMASRNSVCGASLATRAVAAWRSSISARREGRGWFASSSTRRRAMGLALPMRATAGRANRAGSSGSASIRIMASSRSRPQCRNGENSLVPDRQYNIGLTPTTPGPTEG